MYRPFFVPSRTLTRGGDFFAAGFWGFFALFVAGMGSPRSAGGFDRSKGSPSEATPSTAPRAGTSVHGSHGGTFAPSDARAPLRRLHTESPRRNVPLRSVGAGCYRRPLSPPGPPLV